jgi:hypothetical protein
MVANIHNEAITIYAFFSIIIKKVIFSMEATAATAINSNFIEGSTGDNRSVSSSEQSFFKRLKTCNAALLSSVAKETTPTLEDIPSELFIQHILPFVGDHQYRFVAAVNRNFHTAYVTAFPKKVTHNNVSTIEHAKICFDEWKRPYHHPSILCCIAAREGNLTVLNYLRSIQCPWGYWTCASAAENGHLDVIKWCRQNGCPWDSRTCENAAENGHLDVIQWCHENGCPWESPTSEYGAANGHIDVFKWCRQNGCPWDKSTCEALESEGHYDVLQWSFENGCICKVCSKYGNLD